MHLHMCKILLKNLRTSNEFLILNDHQFLIILTILISGKFLKIFCHPELLFLMSKSAISIVTIFSKKKIRKR